MDIEIAIRFLLAALWGGMVGLEREYRSKSAGFRTMIMISMGSCFFTIMSDAIGAPGNPDRIASNVVTGIGFLGAGVIFRGDNRVNGITTAATIWAVAAIGMGIGAGYYLVSTISSFLILIVLAVLPFVENSIDRWSQSRIYTVECNFTPGRVESFRELLKGHQLKVIQLNESRNQQVLTMKWVVKGSVSHHESFIKGVMRDESISRFEY